LPRISAREGTHAIVDAYFGIEAALSAIAADFGTQALL
jgi:hypothetical protein